MKRFETGAELAKEMGLSEKKLAQVFADYVAVTKNPKSDPFGKKLFVVCLFSFLNSKDLTVLPPLPASPTLTGVLTVDPSTSPS